MPTMRSTPRSAKGAAFLLIAGLTTPFSALLAQAAAQAPQVKGIWEPVSYTEDLDLRDVFFVTADVGWASGAGGTIIHTRDGGTTWTAQLGGDPGSTDYRIDRLRFIDEHRGWAVQGKKLLHTPNGQDWEEVSGALPNWMSDYTFLSPRRGVASGTRASQGNATELFLTDDGGRTWKPVAPCAIRVTIDGLNRNLSCIIDRFHFPTPDVGYVVAYVQCVGSGCGGPPIIGKTEDGGASWRFTVGPGDVATTRLRDVFFVDERVGFIHAYTYPGEPKIFATADGGETWKGVVGSPGRSLKFADPEVGWGMHEHKLNYTTDGGRKWNSRPHRFPAVLNAVSFPRRDRGYVVGEHGMVFRYRVVPASAPLGGGAIETVAMTPFASPLEGQAAQVDATVAELRAAVAAATTVPASAGAQVASVSGAEPPSAEAVVAAQPSAFTAGCCGEPLNKLNLVVGAIGTSLPSFLAQFQNANLLLARVRMFTDLPGRFGDLRSALLAFKQAGDKAAAEAALAQAATAAQSLHQATRVAFQQELPPLP